MAGEIILLTQGIAGMAAPFDVASCASDMFYPGARARAREPGEPGEPGGLGELGARPGTVLEGDAPAPLYLAGEAESTFTIAWRLHAEGRFTEDWSAVIACSQRQGRGQFGRYWHSPPGNLYVSFLLPDDALFTGASAALVAGYLLVRAMRGLGVPLVLKWPNDFLLEDADGALHGKAAGLLLEERRGRVVAGLGVNLRDVPPSSVLREAHAVPAASLAKWRFSPVPFWLRLAGGLPRMYAGHIQRRGAADILRDLESILAWRGEQVMVTDGEEETCGRILGLAPGGELRLATRSGIREVDSGSVRKA